MAHLQRIGAISLAQAPESTQISKLQLDSHVAIWVLSRPVKQGDMVTAYVTIISNSIPNLFILR